ncbi:MAG: hypothetical protein ABI759_29845 [Candidatus Solibacter sp.]
MLTRSLLGGMLLAMLPGSGMEAAPKTYKIRSIGRRPDSSAISVNFLTSSAPPADEAEATENWRITIFATNAPVARVTGVRIIDFQVSRLLELTFCLSNTDPCPANRAVLPPGTQAYSVTFQSASGVAVAPPTPFQKPVPAGGAAASSGKDDSTVYLFGGINTAVGTKPTFNIDAAVDFHPTTRGLGIKAATITDNRKKVDPDSFNVKLDYVYVLASPSAPPDGSQIFFQGLLLHWDYAGVEFDRKGKNLNFTTVPYVALPFTASMWDAAGNPLHTWNMELRAGTEGGSNFRNSLNPDGYGGILRTWAGASNAFILRKLGGFERITIGSSYDIRLPYKRELFNHPDADGNAVYSLSRKARHYLTNAVTFGINDYWGLTVKHQYGSLPPAFNFTDHKISMGLTYKFKEK